MLRLLSRSLYTLVLTTVLALCAVAQQSPQLPLAGKGIPQFTQPLPLLTVQGGSINTIVADSSEVQLSMCEFKSKILPPAAVVGTAQAETWVWGYIQGPTCPTATQDTYLGPVFVATRGTPTQIRYTNQLGFAATTNVLPYKYSTDLSLHWADPDMLMCNMQGMMGMPPSPLCAGHYQGAIPAVPHLHGGEVPPVLDGGPDQWFTSDGLLRGESYYSKSGGASNEAIFRYPNTQEAASIWFHDHTLGATRLNVYAGLAGGYIISDPNQQLPANFPGPAQIVPIILQDRMFDTNGQLYFPAGPGAALNPEHPWWVPEFVGDTMVVNGKAWPFMNVEPRRYRFLFLNGSNARTYELFLTNPVTKVNGPAMWQIGSDGGYLDNAVLIDPNAAKGGLTRLTLQPGERADVIIDFGALTPGTTLVLKNTAKTPYPAGATPTGGMDKVMQFRVIAAPAGFADASYNPAKTPAIRSQKIVRIANNPQVTPTKKRQLTLNEVMGMGGTVNGILYPGGPLEILVNNTKWSGDSTRTYGDFTPISVGGAMSTLNYSELPQEGAVEQWEFVNLTADAHPIHLHLVQFQAISRQNFDVAKYSAAYAAAFPTMLYQPGFGPPLSYTATNADGAYGGNPAVTPFLKGPATPANANESGWKDTIITYPGQVTRIMVRYAPTDAPAATAAAYPFETNALNRGYVWHCHIIDHEDNEMMRPVYVTPLAGATRTYVLGVDY
jgi:spore coat protein A